MFKYILVWNPRDTAIRYTYLSWPSDQEITDFIVNQMELIHKQYLESRSLVPDGNLVEVAFTQLESDVVAELKRVYKQLGIPHWEDPQGGKAAMEYACGLEGFRKNDHKRLSEVHRTLISERLGFVFSAWNYNRD
mmetsp:Transcript_3294/g.5316  ORF Transcript_3294/g.5316 Transcript_3294/m.5316 type:complete len:135 (-) Transcript_3294:2729-3133(-)